MKIYQGYAYMTRKLGGNASRIGEMKLKIRTTSKNFFLSFMTGMGGSMEQIGIPQPAVANNLIYVFSPVSSRPKGCFTKMFIFH